MKYPEYELKIRLDKIFPSLPDTKIPSEDIMHRIASLPIYIRTQTCMEMGWDDAKYYRKVSGNVIMTLEEEKRFMEIASKAMKKYSDYVFNRYILPKRRVRKKAYKKFD
ncbi:hypothetical protein [Chitinophaga eiseniae]|uniref:Uncharacterized protein n=1 Tax=Chitinophaga eiseniae TaxID=634771 RepID=A0A847SRR6_9BACT|nr:hypothetical protein [Chitinophaga eiseniae]NLR82275.1 hypothetical protein [Chitinophaga eiseniae]